MKKIFMFLIIGIFLFSLISATTISESFQINEPLNITVTCLNDGYCSASAICNLGSVINPNGTIVIQNENMTNDVSVHYYEFTPTEIGFYSVSGYCEDGNQNKGFDFEFRITTTGENFDNSSLNSAFIIAYILLYLLVFYLSWLAFKIQNNVVKIGLLSFAVLILVFAAGFTNNILEDTLGGSSAISSSFSNFFIVLITLSVGLAVGLILWLIIIALNVYRNKRGMSE